MIYLLNSTESQKIYIPRNESGVNPHKSNSYWEGFEDGYESGETHQKNLLSSVTFTENGEYERENGWSAVTVDVPQTGSTARLEEKTVVISADTTNVTPSSGYDGMSAVTVDASSYAQQNYDNGFDDGFVDGYSSGSTDEKAKLSAVTFTTNTAVTISDGGYSAITVNVPQTGSSLNVEANKSYTANTNGTYTITPSSFQLVVNEGIKRITFDASQYPNEGEYDLGRIYDSSRDYYIEVEFWNGEIDYDDTNWPSGGNYRKYVYRTGDTKMQIEFENLSFEDEDVEWVGNETGYTYDVMSAVTLNVNVKQQFGYIEIIDPDANLCYFELGNITPDLHSKIVLHNVTFSADPGLGYNWRTFLTMCRVERGRICSDMSQVVFDGRTEGRYGITAITDTDITLEYDKVTIGDDVYNYAINETQYEAMTDYNNMVLFNFIKDPSTAGTSTSQARYAKVGEIEIYDSANTLTYDYIPTVDENGIICFYERINDFYVYSSNGNNDYLSANTVNLGKGSFSANGTYSASTYGFDGYSEVTINVPQTGGSTNLGSKTGTTNGTYNASTDNLDGYSAFTINVDTASTYNSGYTSGYTDGQNNIIDTFSAMTATTNGQYGSSAHPLSAITVEVPQTGSSIPLSSITFTANTSVTVTDKAFTAITVNVPQSGANITDTIVYVTANTQAVSASHYNIDGFGNVLLRAEYCWH